MGNWLGITKLEIYYLGKKMNGENCNLQVNEWKLYKPYVGDCKLNSSSITWYRLIFMQMFQSAGIRCLAANQFFSCLGSVISESQVLHTTRFSSLDIRDPCLVNGKW